MAKRIGIAFVLLGFAFSLFFGFTLVHIDHDGMAGEPVCIIMLLRGGLCPALEDIVSSLSFHLGGFKILSTAILDGPLLGFLLVFVFLLLAAIAGTAFLNLPSSRHSLYALPAVTQDFLQWFSYKLHSPPSY